MTRAQCIVVRGRKVLMVKHRHMGAEWWCLPGGGVEAGESAPAAALRELKEECNVMGNILYQTSVYIDETGIESITFVIDIKGQEPCMGNDPEFAKDHQILVDLQWLSLDEIPERDRAYLWAAGLLSVSGFVTEVSGWGDAISYPGKETKV